MRVQLDPGYQLTGSTLPPRLGSRSCHPPALETPVHASVSFYMFRSWLLPQAQGAQKVRFKQAPPGSTLVGGVRAPCLMSQPKPAPPLASQPRQLPCAGGIAIGRRRQKVCSMSIVPDRLIAHAPGRVIWTPSGCFYRLACCGSPYNESRSMQRPLMFGNSQGCSESGIGHDANGCQRSKSMSPRVMWWNCKETFGPVKFCLGHQTWQQGLLKAKEQPRKPSSPKQQATRP